MQTLKLLGEKKQTQNSSVKIFTSASLPARQRKVTPIFFCAKQIDWTVSPHRLVTQKCRTVLQGERKKKTKQTKKKSKGWNMSWALGAHQWQSQPLEGNGQRGKALKSESASPMKYSSSSSDRKVVPALQVCQMSYKLVQMSDRMILTCCKFQDRSAWRQTHSIFYALNTTEA